MDVLEKLHVSWVNHPYRQDTLQVCNSSDSGKPLCPECFEASGKHYKLALLEDHTAFVCETGQHQFPV